MGSIITKIEMQKRNKRRVNIYMDNEFAFACDAELIYIHNITKGRSMDKEDLEGIACEDNYIKGKNAALHFLEKSFKSEKQVSDKLTIKEFDIKTIDRVLEFLKQYDFVNDERFIELFIKEKIRSIGKNRIKFTLIKKSLPKELINEAISKITSEQQLEVALKLGEKRLVTLSKNENDTKKLYKKISDYLARNGYNYEIIKKVLARIINNDREENIKESILDDEQTIKENYNKLYELADKRYNILIKSESSKIKLYKKLGDYLLRRGYQWDQIKKILKELINQIDEIDNATNEGR
ncbi:recombination regulator RecX [Clostridium psychrophilum]|uniref:recombination regulator RecX n=1 Tax=Clostridium psychrophilum TaxID=132926 RepID=UPI001FEC5F86|nr:recombination regulator RecX [Clostridium psychrophilum]